MGIGAYAADSEREALLDYFERRVALHLDRLAAHSAEGEGVTRLLYSPAWLAGQRAAKDMMERGGLVTRFDEVGNLFGRLQGKRGTGTILTGSHIDTVVNGGKYDGAYGVAAGIAALEYLKQSYGTPNRSLEVVSLCEEEGSRFPLAYWGSGSIAGERSFSQIQELEDDNGVAFSEAMSECGFGEGSAAPARRTDIHAFIELHVEQGTVLESRNMQIGIVEAIVGQRRMNVEIIGEANHAGTTPMLLRRDALEGAAAMIGLLRQEALRKGAPLVATVGRLLTLPNVPNVVAGQVSFTVDVRHSDSAALDEFCSWLAGSFRLLAEERGLAFRCEEWFREEPVPMHAGMGSRLDAICSDLGIGAMRMVSGAGHDAQMMGRVCPSAMLFVPSRRGISHSPEEYTAPRELAVGALALATLLYQLGYEEGRS